MRILSYATRPLREKLDESLGGHHLVELTRADQVVELACSNEYEVIVIDWRPSTASKAAALVESLRLEQIETPILVVAAQRSDIVKALQAGADDCLSAKFDPLELMARLEALLRRHPRLSCCQPTLCAGLLEYDQLTHQVIYGNQPIKLKPLEKRILELLIRYKNKPVPKTMLYEYAWGASRDYFNNRLEVQIARLRKKIDHRFDTKMIHTVRYVGYKLTA